MADASAPAECSFACPFLVLDGPHLVKGTVYSHNLDTPPAL